MNDILDYLARVIVRERLDYVLWPALAMLVGTMIGTLFPKGAARLALVPRKLQGAVGLVTAPFIHANFAHFAANLPPFLVLGVLVLRHNETEFLEIALTVALGQGILLWLFGRNAAHVGMSGVIFGFLGYLLALGWYSRTTPDLLVAGAVLLFYGGMLWGVTPTRDGTSWEGHLFGLMAGLATAWVRSGGFGG